MSKLTDWNSVINFGKHKGKSVQEVFDEAGGSGYLAWLVDNTERTDFDKEVEDAIFMDHMDNRMADGFGSFMSSQKFDDRLNK